MPSSNFYLDTEFYHTRTQTQLISIGIVSADGREYYAVSSDFDEATAAREPWLREYVLPQLLPLDARKTEAHIRAEITEFVGYTVGRFWAIMGVYDWYLLLQLYGGVSALPANISLFYRELMQEAEQLGLSREQLPANPRPHHALYDAHWARQVHEYLKARDKPRATHIQNS